MTDEQWGPPVFPTYFPYMPEASGYVLRKVPDSPEGVERAVPPKRGWISEKYGKTPEEYLASGRRDMDDMLAVLERAGVTLESLGNILEFGCGDGRMIRWLEHLARDREVWGTDIHAGRIFWCKQHLSPPLRFATTTIVPHLPFEDRHFGFIFAGSVFSHIDDLADAWFAELRRILRPGGKLFITVHLRHDIDLLNERYPKSGLARLLRTHPDYERFVGTDYDMFTVGRSSESYVFYDPDYLRKTLASTFNILSISGPVRLYQNAVLLERP